MEVLEGRDRVGSGTSGSCRRGYFCGGYRRRRNLCLYGYYYDGRWSGSRCVRSTSGAFRDDDYPYRYVRVGPVTEVGHVRPGSFQDLQRPENLQRNNREVEVPSSKTRHSTIHPLGP